MSQNEIKPFEKDKTKEFTKNIQEYSNAYYKACHSSMKVYYDDENLLKEMSILCTRHLLKFREHKNTGNVCFDQWTRFVHLTVDRLK